MGAQTLTADQFRFGFRIEEKSQSGLRVGLGGGQFDLRLKDRPNATLVDEFDGEFLFFYLRWPVALNPRLTLHTRFDYRFHTGNRSGIDPQDEIDWIETGLTAGIALRVGMVSLQPYASVSSIDGDITSDAATRLLNDAEHHSYGLMLDIHVEPTAYVRFQAGISATEALFVSFVREY